MKVSQGLLRLQRKGAPLHVLHAGHPSQDACWVPRQILAILYFPEVETGFEGAMGELCPATTHRNCWGLGQALT